MVARSELIAFKITQGNKNDGKQAKSLFKSLQGLAFGDKGYICKKLFDELQNQGLKLMTRYRKIMKHNPELSDYEKQLLNQRNLIERACNNFCVTAP